MKPEEITYEQIYNVLDKNGNIVFETMDNFIIPFVLQLNHTVRAYSYAKHNYEVDCQWTYDYESFWWNHVKDWQMYEQAEKEVLPYYFNYLYKGKMTRSQFTVKLLEEEKYLINKALQDVLEENVIHNLLSEQLLIERKIKYHKSDTGLKL